jgi:hypothetical protein
MILGVLWRRLRGLLGTSVTWAAVWAVVGLGIGSVFWLSGASLHGLEGLGWLRLWGVVGLVTGAVVGVAFSFALMVLGRRGETQSLNPLGFGVVGAIAAGAITTFVFGAPVPAGLTGAIIGFLCGSGSIVLARRAWRLSGQSSTRLPPAA